MKVIAVVSVDLERTPLGTRSRIGDELHGETVLRRTLRRVQRIDQVESIHLLCPATQSDRCAALVAGLSVTLHRHSAGAAPWTALVQAARKWSLDGWRGGIGQATSLDEYTDSRLLAGLLEQVDADAVLSIPGAASLLDPGLGDRMIEHRKRSDEQVRLVFTQAPPGLAGALIDADLVQEIAKQNIPIGWLFSYKPDSPLKDMIFQPACCDTPADVRHAAGRLVVDTQRAYETAAALLDDHPDPDAATAGRWLLTRQRDFVEALPREVEIELTTDDPYPSAQLRPRGANVPSRGPMDLGVIERIASELLRYDDSLVVLGGFGDPLRHPQLVRALEILRPETGPGVYGLCVRTAAADLTEAMMATLIAHKVDALNVILDAWTPELYGQLQAPEDPSRADLGDVLARLDRLTKMRQERHVVYPILVPELTKSRLNLHELDSFYDGWVRRAGAACIGGYSHRAGHCADHAVMSMAPAARSACRRLRSRCLILADGRMAVCDQDFRGLHTVGRIGERSLAALWRGDGFEGLRDAHRNGRYDAMPLCPRCDEWHRP